MARGSGGKGKRFLQFSYVRQTKLLADSHGQCANTTGFFVVHSVRDVVSVTAKHAYSAGCMNISTCCRIEILTEIALPPVPCPI